jgi:hypothetical protein
MASNDEQTDYIRRRTKRALALKALRDLRKTVDTLEAAEKAAGLSETKIVLGIWIAIFLVILSFGVYNRFANAPARAISSTQIVGHAKGMITSWDAKNFTAQIVLATGGRLECIAYPAFPRECMIDSSLNLGELSATQGVLIYQYRHPDDADAPIKRTLYKVVRPVPPPRFSPIRFLGKQR